MNDYCNKSGNASSGWVKAPGAPSLFRGTPR